jgi:hypothetical protein
MSKTQRGIVVIACALLAAVAAVAISGLPDHGSKRRLGADAAVKGAKGAAGYQRLYDSANTDGRAGSGATANAYRPGGQLVTDPSVMAQLPQARLFRTGYGGWEPTLGINKQGTIFYNARNTNVDPGVVRSKDGGRTWEAIAPPSHSVSLDPFLWVDTKTGRVFDSDIEETITCPPVSVSDDQGATWTDGQVCGHADYQKIFGGPPPAGGKQPTGYPNVVYFCAITGGEGVGSVTENACSKTLDGGKSWALTGSPSYPVRAAPAGSPTGSPNCDGAAPPGVVDSKGTIYLPRGWCGEPWIAISHDEGDSWDRVKLPGKPLPYDSGNGGWANDSGVAVDANGNLFYTWVADDFHPYLSTSRDGGKTWSAPVDILPPGVTRTQNPAIDVGAPGKIAIEFVGSQDPKDTADAKLTWNGYISMSANALDPSPTFFAAPVNDPKTNGLWKGACGSPIRCGNMGDFYEVRIGPDGTPRAAFVDSCPNSEKCTQFGVTDPRGEAVMGQLVGGPSLAAGGATGPLPPSRRCVDRRKFGFRLHHARGARVVNVQVFVNGKRKLTRHGRNIRRVTLTRLPRKKFTVTVVSTQSTGSKLISTRTYRGCTKSPPHSRRPHHSS